MGSFRNYLVKRFLSLSAFSGYYAFDCSIEVGIPLSERYQVMGAALYRLIEDLVVIMAVIRMSREHTLDVEEAKASAEELVVRLAEKFGVKYHWEDETVKFKGSGAKGYMSIMPQKLDLKMELGFMLLPFKSRIEKEMTQYLDEFCS